MDSGIEHVSNLMGKYLLSGWVLTDTVCPTQDCNVPLFRSKDSTIWFCVLCDKEPGKSKSQSKQQPPPSTMINVINDNDNYDNKVGSIQQPYSQFDLDNVKDDKDDEFQQLKIRRDQSQRASHLIGQYLLQGWALIDQICPNETCYGVPLIRSRDKKKYCVICQNYYMNESDFDPSRHNLTTLQVDSPINDTINEKKHQIDIKEIESTIQQLGKKVQNSLSNTNNITLEQNDTNTSNHQHNVLRKCVSTLSTKLEELSILLENTSDISDIKNICNTIESCAQALGAIKSLDHS